MKKKLLFLVAALALFVPSVMAAEKTAGTDEELIKAFSETATGDTIKLTADIEHKGNSNSLMVKDNKNITLDLNGFNITVDPELTSGKTYGVYRSITVYGGTLTIKGKGTIKHTTQNALNVWGSDKEVEGVYSKLNVEKDVVIEGSTGIAIYEGSKDEGAYGVEVNFYGTIKATDFGITTNGFIENENGPVVNIKKGAVITSTEAAGVYIAGNSTYNVEDGTTITGLTGIEVRAGNLNLNGGTITGTADKVHTEKNGNGSTSEGAGIAVVQHTTKLPINVKIINGTIKGAEALFVNNTEENSAEAWAKVKVVAEGGVFSTDVAKYAADKYVVKKTTNGYEVVENKVLETKDEKVSFESDKALDSDLKLEVTEKDKEEVTKGNEKVAEKYKEDKKVKDVKLISLYDINVTNGIQVVPMEDGKFTIAIAIPETEQKYDTYKVVYIDEDGKIAETLDAKLVEGKVVFTTTHLSTYGVVGYNNVTETETKTENNPKTADINMALVIGAILISVAGVVITSKKISAKVTR